MTTEITKTESEIVSNLFIKGDISGLTPDQKITYYRGICQRLGLDPLTQPFKLLKLQGKEVLYCDRSGAQQLNKLHNVSHAIQTRATENDLYIVTCRASIGDRFTDSIGAVNVKGLTGDALANAIMKGETKAKRRATLDIVGLGMLDETEVETIKYAEVIPDEIFKTADELKDDYLKALTELEQVTKGNPPFTTAMLPDNWKKEQTRENFVKAIEKVRKMVGEERALRNLPVTEGEVAKVVADYVALDDFKERKK